jgi:hypothetical protein
MIEPTQTYEQVIDVASLQRNWPLGHVVPNLIIEIATFLKPYEIGSMGYFTMKGVRFDDYWIEGGADLCEEFGFFLTLPDGSKIGQWFHENVIEGGEPIVGIGSEGDLIVLAPNLKAFMTDWAKGKGWLDIGLAGADETPEVHALWHEIGAQMRVIIDKAPDHPAGAPIANLSKFIENYGKASIQKMVAHPLHQEILRLMADYVPKGEDKLANYNLQIKIAGSRVELLPDATPQYYPKRAPVPPEAQQLIALIQKLREERAGGIHTGRGLWHTASLQIFQGDIFDLPHPLVMLKADWEFEPGFETGGRVTKAQLDADLARFPRDPRWMMDWMGELT